MKDALLYYSIGALLYCPANNLSITNSLVNEKFGKQFSLALCLEDTIRDEFVSDAEQTLKQSLSTLLIETRNKEFYMPKIFIRVRAPQQIERINYLLQDAMSLITGFIIPKFSLENADVYINEILKINQLSNHKIYMMPIFESPSMINLINRYNILYTLKDKLDIVSDLVLNIRVGGNDLCHNFGFRRNSDESIYQILPISIFLADIVAVFGMNYVVSGPVWEYYNGSNWDTGLRNELKSDMLNGFIGKTVIHPNQIRIVNEALAVNQADYDDAVSILNWNHKIASLVSGNSESERMNEYKTHHIWAKKVLILSEIYGINKKEC